MVTGIRISVEVRAACTLLLLLVTASVAGGCRSGPPPVQTVPHAFVKRAQMHMGTLATLTAVAPTDAQAQEAVSEGFKEIRRLERLWSTWIPESELSRINAAAGRDRVVVSPETMVLLHRSVDAARMTQGAFNIAMGPAVEAWNISKDPRIPNPQDLERLRPLLDLSAMQLNEPDQTVYLVKPGMRIDVGGIGKGYAADLVAEVMRRHGATGGVVALSGDIKAFGDLPGGAGFPIGIQHPRKSGTVLARVVLRDEAISTAGDYERYFERDGVIYHHILDPRTLQPARLCQSVTIIAKEGVWADGLDTGVFVLGPERGMALIEALPDVEGVIVDADGTVLISSGLQGRLTLEP